MAHHRVNAPRRASPQPPSPGGYIHFDEQRPDRVPDLRLTYNHLDIVHYEPAFEWQLFFKYVMPQWYRGMRRCGVEYTFEPDWSRDATTTVIWLPLDPEWRRRASFACRPLVRWVMATRRQREPR